MKCILMKCCTWFDNSPFDYPLKAERLEEVERELERPSIWDNPEEATKLGQERASLAGVVHGLDEIQQGLQDAYDLIELAEAENDEATRQHWLQQTADMVDKYSDTLKILHKEQR